MKLNKEQLKSVIKECLVEILSEGISFKENTKSRNLKNLSDFKTQNQSKQNLQMLDTSIQETIRRESKGNSVMADILADTAMRTLPAIQEAEGRKQPVPNGPIERLVSETDPKSLFGDETTSKWAALAFNEVGKK
jgi:hypothetical protein